MQSSLCVPAPVSLFWVLARSVFQQCSVSYPRSASLRACCGASRSVFLCSRVAPRVTTWWSAAVALRTVDGMPQQTNDEKWVLPGALDVLPADGPGGIVAPVSTLECVEVDPPDHAVLLGPELSDVWHRVRDHHRDRLSSSIMSFNGEIPLTVDLDPLERRIVWYRSDYASHVASLDVMRMTGAPRPGLDLAPSILVLIACKEGWVRSRRSGKVAMPHHWQHAAAETLTLEDLGGVLDLRMPALRAVREEFALDVSLERMRPWLVQCQGEPGHGARFVFYVVADLRELTLSDVRSSQRRASDAWEIDEVSAASLPGDWEGLRTLPRLLLPYHDPDTWFGAALPSV